MVTRGKDAYDIALHLLLDRNLDCLVLIGFHTGLVVGCVNMFITTIGVCERSNVDEFRTQSQSFEYVLRLAAPNCLTPNSRHQIDWNRIIVEQTNE